MLHQKVMAEICKRHNIAAWKSDLNSHMTMWIIRRIENQKFPSRSCVDKTNAHFWNVGIIRTHAGATVRWTSYQLNQYFSKTSFTSEAYLYHVCFMYLLLPSSPCLLDLVDIEKKLREAKAERERLLRERVSHLPWHLKSTHSIVH